MSDQREPRIPFWAKGIFFLGDALLLLVGLLLVMESPRPMPWNHLALLVACVTAAGFLGAIPFWLEYQASIRLTEAHGLQSSLVQIQRLEAVGEDVRLATGQWQAVQEHCNRAVKSAQEITDQMIKEGRAFTEFMGKAQDSERSHLRLEVEKLRRAESEWLEVLVRISDHVYALYRAAMQSGDPTLVQQLTLFQRAVREAVRRVGLVAHEAEAGALYDEAHHQLADPDQKPWDGAEVGETLAVGYTMQGQKLRRIVVVLKPKPDQEQKMPGLAIFGGGEGGGSDGGPERV